MENEDPKDGKTEVEDTTNPLTLDEDYPVEKDPVWLNMKSINDLVVW